MFEKEAEEYRKDLKSKFFLSEPQLDLACQGFKDGYNKCNERLIKANEIIEGLMRFCRCFAQHHTEDIRYKEAEQFLRELEE